MKYQLIIILLIYHVSISFGQSQHYQLLKQQFDYHSNKSITFDKLRLPTIIQLNQEPSTLLELKNTEVPEVYKYEDLAFFCRLEVQMEKVTKIPIRFRLGDVQYIEKLEGKPYSPFLIGY